MTGKESYSISELQNFVESLEKYSNDHGVFTSKINYEVEGIINLTEKEMKELTVEECYEKSYSLSGYCNYVQSITNRHTSILGWCNDSLNKIVTKEAEQFSKYMKWEQKCHAVVQSNDFAQKIWDAKVYAQGQVTWLTDKIRDMRRMAETLLNYAKRKTYS